MANTVPTEDDLIEALEKKRERAAKLRTFQRKRWAAKGSRLMTPELAREIRDFKANNPKWTQKQIGQLFGFSHEMIGRVLRRTIYPNA